MTFVIPPRVAYCHMCDTAWLKAANPNCWICQQPGVTDTPEWHRRTLPA